MKIDAATKLWIRTDNDQWAADKGSRFDRERAAWTIWWIERFCRLYEGENAGEHILLRSGNPTIDKQNLEDWDEGGKAKTIARLKKYEQWVKKDPDAHRDWQFECFAQIFGWVKHSTRFDREIRRFNQVVVFIPKKNKKTPSLAALGVYLTCGDGEQGAKAFGGAKDSKQAMLAQKHAIAMVEQSPELTGECKINQNEKSITHTPTRSVYFPLSSGNSRHQQAKEGLNGNVLIDEVHVVDREFVDIISRAGISRAEPLRVEVSTAGNNPDGYGKERADYARKVLTGAEENPSLFAAIYEAPQDLSDADLLADPLKYGKMANPAWGHTTHEEEYLSDFAESQSSLRALANFKMYRLNIWQHTANQWLDLQAWLDCGSEYTLASLPPGRAAAGLDLSKTRDMSALVLAIPIDGVTHLVPRIWVTEEYAASIKDKAARLTDWGLEGALTIIPGETIQQSFIKQEFTKLKEQYNIEILVYDKTYASEFVEWMDEEHKRVVTVEYPQSSAFMEKPIDDFEAKVTNHEIRHPNNPCLTWQAGHTAVAENAKGHRILAKPKRDDYRKIDGMVASVMAEWGTTQLPKTQLVYRRRGVIAV